MRYGGLNGWPTTRRPGLAATVAMSVMGKPEVDEAMITSAGVTASMSARSARLSSRSSGPLSWTNPAPSTASARVGSTVRLSGDAPSASPSSVRAGQAPSTMRRSFASASGAGSHARTRYPRARKWAAQPPPMTPAPMHATVRMSWGSGTGVSLQVQDAAGVVGLGDGAAESLHDGHRALDELGVGGLDALGQVQVVLESDPHVPAEQCRVRDPRQ